MQRIGCSIFTPPPPHKHTHTRTRTHTHTHIHTHTHTHTQTHTHTHSHTYMYTRTHTLTHTYTHAHIHTLTHTHTDSQTYIFCLFICLFVVVVFKWLPFSRTGAFFPSGYFIVPPAYPLPPKKIGCRWVKMSHPLWFYIYFRTQSSWVAIDYRDRMYRRQSDTRTPSISGCAKSGHVTTNLFTSTKSAMFS